MLNELWAQLTDTERETRDKAIVQARDFVLHDVILEIGNRLSSGDNAMRAPATAGGGAATPSAPTAADVAGASTLYFKAMQEYADGKPDRAWDLLQSGAKLDPGNQDIAKAVERLAKER